MSESQPITTPPRRRHDHPVQQFLYNPSSAESCKNTPNVTRKLEPYHHALLESGSQSAKSSPLPHRRLDKLEGMIRDKASPMILRRRLEACEVNSSNESSPAFRRKCSYGSCHDSPQSRRKNDDLLSLSQCGRRNTTDCGCASQSVETNSPAMRRRLESDCTCTSHVLQKTSENAMSCSPQMRRKNLFGSPAKGVIGEPGCFSSPVHRSSETSSFNFGSPARSVLGEPGVFASPSRSACMSPCDENLEAEQHLQPDLTVVSGWMKFRDNKRVSLIFIFNCFIALILLELSVYLI